MTDTESFTRYVAGSSPSKDSPFYNPNLQNVSAEVLDLLEQYSGISHERLIPHVKKIRDRAWEIYPYPCIGMFRFLDISLRFDPHYPAIVSRLKHRNHRFLDLGCGLSTEIRLLASDGVPSENLFGADNRPEFVELGYDLFLDRDRLQATFLAADVFDPTSDLNELHELVDIVHAGSFFQLFKYEEQVEIGKRVVKLLKPVKGSFLIGQQVGSEDSGVLEGPDHGEILYRHNEESWVELWDDVSEQTGVELDVFAHLEDSPRIFVKEGQPGEMWLADPKRLRFTVMRL